MSTAIFQCELALLVMLQSKRFVWPRTHYAKFECTKITSVRAFVTPGRQKENLVNSFGSEKKARQPI